MQKFVCTRIWCYMCMVETKETNMILERVGCGFHVELVMLCVSRGKKMITKVATITCIVIFSITTPFCDSLDISRNASRFTLLSIFHKHRSHGPEVPLA